MKKLNFFLFSTFIAIALLFPKNAYGSDEGEIPAHGSTTKKRKLDLEKPSQEDQRKKKKQRIEDKDLEVSCSNFSNIKLLDHIRKKGIFNKEKISFWNISKDKFNHILYFLKEELNKKGCSVKTLEFSYSPRKIDEIDSLQKEYENIKFIKYDGIKINNKPRTREKPKEKEVVKEDESSSEREQDYSDDPDEKSSSSEEK